MRPKHMYKGETLTWTLRVYAPAGTPVDPVSAPTIAVLKSVNGVLTPLADPVTVTKRGVGAYDCAYSPVDPVEEGDQFSVDETVVLNLGSGNQSYKNTFEFVVNTEELTGGGIRLVEALVESSDNTPIPNATVHVQDAFGVDIGFQATTNTLGKAKFNLNDGDYRFLVSAVPDYETHVAQPYTVTANNTTPTLTLIPQDSPPEEEDSGAIEVDLSGIKKVKTKHMEIEAFDPRIMQEARDKETNSLPTFCGVHFCVGTPAVRRSTCRN